MKSWIQWSNTTKPKYSINW